MLTEALPPETLSQILDHVDEPSDVLNVTLSRKTLYSIAVQHHLQYRNIRSRLQNPSLSTWFTRADGLRASHIHSLTLLPDQDSDFYHIRHSYDVH